jgi:Fe-S cluster biogenesis protein NfuA
MLGRLARQLAWHAGGVELVEVTASGVVELRFTGMCTGCPLRPMTMEATIRPALMSVAGVRDVTAPGARLAQEALTQLRARPAPDGRATAGSHRAWLGGDVRRRDSNSRLSEEHGQCLGIDGGE